MTNIIVPELGESVVEARVSKWHKQAGDRVAVGEALVELETEKVDIAVSADAAGVVTRIARHEGEDVKVGELLAEVDEAGVPASTVPASTAPADAPATAAGDIAAPAAVGAAPRATPTARRAAADAGLDLASVKGTGDGGRVMKADVVGRPAPQASGARTSPANPAPAASQTPATTPTSPAPPTTRGTATATATPRAAAAAPAQTSPVPTPVAPDASGRTEERVRMSKRRLTIARRLVEAQHTAAMLTTFNDADMTGVVAIRERHKDDFRARFGAGLGYTSFFVKAAVAALKAFPRLNAEIQGDEIVLKHYYDIGIAVGAEGGLVVPVLRDADRLTFGGIESGVRAFAARANDGTLTLEDLRGGTFTITNGGVFGSLLSTPILNPPQVGILGLHKVSDRPVAVNGQVVIRPVMGLALSYDHRIVDGREAVQFLVMVKALIEDPGQLLLES